ncbi:MAG: hypothetical protein AAF602_07365 [Myxococcota bacterium]
MNPRTSAALARRAPVARAARHEPFVNAFMDAVPAGGHVVSMAGGIGATVEWLWERSERWTLTVVDTEDELLEQVPPWLARTERRSIHELDGWAVSVDGVVVAGLDHLDFDGLALLARWVVRQGAPVFTGPTLDGTIRWRPGHESDDAVQAAVRLHQRAVATGPDAAGWFADHLRILGYDVQLASAPWRVVPSDRATIRRLVDQTASTAAAIHPDRATVDAWRHTRLLQARAEVVQCSVGQCDLLGLPPR